MAISGYWQDHINPWQNSGLSQAAYCRLSGDFMLHLAGAFPFYWDVPKVSIRLWGIVAYLASRVRQCILAQSTQLMSIHVLPDAKIRISS
ncbi:IS66 family insertion sequence element accessory protein TnpA [Candidatus Methylospira mobilis]|uniref:IS66 family insertion sequence element accessory protein TnpA n=1 Tax=Candidatus Methylospira mobilis TaxID=1808979 RepID=UPI00387EACC5